jgi:hypothetical protein
MYTTCLGARYFPQVTHWLQFLATFVQKIMKALERYADVGIRRTSWAGGACLLAMAGTAGERPLSRPWAGPRRGCCAVGGTAGWRPSEDGAAEPTGLDDGVTHAAPADAPYTATLARRPLGRWPRAEACDAASDTRERPGTEHFHGKRGKPKRNFSTLVAPQWQRGEPTWCSGQIAGGCWAPWR